MKKRKGKDKRVSGIVVIGNKRYAIKLIVFPREGVTVELMGSFYEVKKVKFKEVKTTMVPIIYLTKTAKIPKMGK